MNIADNLRRIVRPGDFDPLVWRCLHEKIRALEIADVGYIFKSERLHDQLNKTLAQNAQSKYLETIFEQGMKFSFDRLLVQSVDPRMQLAEFLRCGAVDVARSTYPRIVKTPLGIAGGTVPGSCAYMAPRGLHYIVVRTALIEMALLLTGCLHWCMLRLSGHLQPSKISMDAAYGAYAGVIRALTFGERLTESTIDCLITMLIEAAPYPGVNARSMIRFTVLHEFAHVLLGHLVAGRSTCREDEFAADAWAFEMWAKQIGSLVHPGENPSADARLLCMNTILDWFENLRLVDEQASTIEMDDHPSAAARQQRLCDRFGITLRKEHLSFSIMETVRDRLR